jgi:hypothetical protein
VTDDEMSPAEMKDWSERAADWGRRQWKWHKEHVKEAPIPAPVPAKSARTATKPKQAPTPAPPRRRGPTITLTDVPEPSVWQRLNAAPQPPPWTPSTDAHDTGEDTPCRTCGGPVQAEGARYVGPWRQHPECESVAGFEPARAQAACRRLGVGNLDLADAALVAEEVRCLLYAEHRAHVEPVWDDSVPLRRRMRWAAHIDRKALGAAVADLPVHRVRAGLDPGTCVDGGCGWCGVDKSCDWVAVDRLTWADGSPSPLCANCYAAWERHGEPQFPDDVRVALAELLTGVPPQGEQPPEALKPYLDVAVAEHAGGQRWAHLGAEAVHKYRLASWARFDGYYAPAEHREEVMAHLAERRRAAAARAQEKAAEQAAKSNTFGF